MAKPAVTVEDRDLGLKRIMAELLKAPFVSTKVGLPAEAPVASGPAKRMSELATVGAVHEFGAPAANIAERSWLRSAYDKNKAELQRVKAREYDRILQGKQSTKVAIGRVGEWMTGKVKEGIEKGPFKPLKASTLARKHPKTKPLIDTAQMIQSITHVE